MQNILVENEIAYKEAVTANLLNTLLNLHNQQTDKTVHLFSTLNKNHLFLLLFN